MSKCYICNKDQVQVGSMALSIDNGVEFNVPVYNIDLYTHIEGKSICGQCMDTYYKIYALVSGQDFVVAGVEYFADGRNLELKTSLD